MLLICHFHISRSSQTLNPQGRAVRNHGPVWSGCTVAPSTSKMVLPFARELARPNRKRPRFRSWWPKRAATRWSDFWRETLNILVWYHLEICYMSWIMGSCYVYSCHIFCYPRFVYEQCLQLQRLRFLSFSGAGDGFTHDMGFDPVPSPDPVASVGICASTVKSYHMDPFGAEMIVSKVFFIIQNVFFKYIYFWIQLHSFGSSWQILVPQLQLLTAGSHKWFHMTVHQADFLKLKMRETIKIKNNESWQAEILDRTKKKCVDLIPAPVLYSSCEYHCNII